VTGSLPAEIETVSSLRAIFDIFTDRIDLLGARSRLTRAYRLAIIFQEAADIFADEAEEEDPEAEGENGF